jgi:hypothetical protein
MLHIKPWPAAQVAIVVLKMTAEESRAILLNQGR